jgi:hypothetical protein
VACEPPVSSCWLIQYTNADCQLMHIVTDNMRAIQRRCISRQLQLIPYRVEQENKRFPLCTACFVQWRSQVRIAGQNGFTEAFLSRQLNCTLSLVTTSSIHKISNLSLTKLPDKTLHNQRTWQDALKISRIHSDTRMKSELQDITEQPCYVPFQSITSVSA